jgi:2,3-bisphosphoglycerate-independent phosphoglycerate mutase
MKITKKIAILIGDGMSDYPIDVLGGKTPLESANTPNMDFAAKNGVLGLTRTVPAGMNPGSDTANLSIFGYDPSQYYTGRAPLEALNMGIEMSPDDVAVRCNIVTIENNIMSDFSAGHIETEFTKIVIDDIKKNLSINNIEFFPGVSYRNIMIWRDYPHSELPASIPPHDISGRDVREYFPHGPGSDLFKKIMTLSENIISGSDLIKKNKKSFRGNPTSLWLWGSGKKPSMKPLNERFGLHGYTISAVDLIHGIGRAAGLTPIHVQGSTGYIDTNYTGKADALIEALKNSNFVFLHVESPDESGHEGNLEHKIKSIEDFDEKIVGRVINRLNVFDDFTVLIMPDHPTPVSLRTHTSDPVPFCIYNKNGIYKFNRDETISGFNETSALKTKIFIDSAHMLIEMIVNDRF